MPYSHSRPLKLNYELRRSDSERLTSGHSSPAGQTVDSALDSALRSVPLPEGLMTRLTLLAYTVPDEAADRVDWLGC